VIQTQVVATQKFGVVAEVNLNHLLSQVKKGLSELKMMFCAKYNLFKKYKN
jgi:hypothetical protein